MGTPLLHINVAYSTTGTNLDLNNCPQRKEWSGRPLNEEDQAASSSRKLDRVPYSPKPHRTDVHESPDEKRDHVLGALSEGAAMFGGQYVLSILIAVSRLARWPITLCIAIFLLTLVVGYISQVLVRAFEPLCIIPGISSMLVCKPGPGTSSSTNPRGTLTPKGAEHSKLMNVQTQSFERLLGDAVGRLTLLEVEYVEIGTTNCVRVSDLKAKDALTMSLYEFTKDAKTARRGLQKLTSKVGRAADIVIAVNKYALQSIASAREKEPSPWSLGSLVSWIASTQRVDEVVTRTFDETMKVFSAHMERLIVEVKQNIHRLYDLEEQLANLHRAVTHEDASISSAKSELLEDLWTKLGGNRESLRSYECDLFLLKRLGGYRKQALIHVVAALQAVHAMSEDIEDICERVAAPDLMTAAVPVEVHMKSFQAGLERLREGTI